MPNKNKIGEKIKTLMEVRNVSLEELANDSDVNIELVEKILNGEIIPSLTPLTKIARVLGVRIGTFIDDDEQTGPLVVRKGKSDKVVYFSGDENKPRTVTWSSTHWLPEKVTETWNHLSLTLKWMLKKAMNLALTKVKNSFMFLKEQLKLFMVRITMF